MKTSRDYTVHYDDSIGEITVPKGTILTHETAVNRDERYHFVASWSWYKPELKGYARKMHMLDLEHKGLDVPKEYVDYEIKMKILEIKFEGIDDWNRPVFKHTKSKLRFGDVNNLFSYYDVEDNDKFKQFMVKYKENPNDYLQYFGRTFNCEPNGGLAKDIQLKIID